MLRKVISVLLSVILIIGVFAIVPISASADSRDAISYCVGSYSFNTRTDGSAYFAFDGKEFDIDDSFDSGSIGSKLPHLKNQNVVYELHNSKIAKVYTIDEVIYPKITVSHSDTEELYYIDGKFSRSSFELQVNITPQLSEQFLDDDLLWFLSDIEKERLYLNLTGMKITTPYGADFGSSGFAFWKSYTDELNESYNDDIKVNETKTYHYTVNLRNDKVYSQTEYSMDFDVIPKFDFGDGSSKTAKIQIVNLDEYAAIAEAKKASSPSGKAEKSVADSLSLNGNLVTASTTWNNFFTKEQSRQLDEFAYVWVSDLILAEIIDYSQFDLKTELAKKVQQEVLSKLGIDEKIITTGTKLSGSVNILTETKDGTEVLVNYVADLSSFKFGLFSSDRPFGVTGQLKLSVYRISDGSQMGMTETLIANYTDIDAFIENLQAIAKSTIFNIGKDVYGLSAKKAASAITDGLMTKALNSKSECFSVVSRLTAKQKSVVQKVTSKVIAGELKKCNETVFKMLTTTSNSAKLHRFECPVNVKVYDNSGNYCGGIINGQVDSLYHEVFATLNGEAKDFYTIGDDYYFVVSGYDTGTMKYTVKEFDKRGEIRKLSYENVPIENGGMYYSMSPQAENLSNIYFDLVDNKGNVISPTSGQDDSDVDSNSDYTLASGKCGTNVSYYLYNDGTLEINGSGTMNNYAYTVAPWYSFREKIKHVVISYGVTNVGDSAFEGCSSIIDVDISNTVTIIEDASFSNCSALTELIIPNSVKTIGSFSFSRCSSLSTINIPDSVTSVGMLAFYDCTALSAVHISDLNAWLNIEFDGRLSNPLSFAHNLYLNNELLTELIIPDSVTHIGNCVFTDCMSLTSITIGNSVDSIGSYAFYYCSNLKCITIPDSVTSIGERAFWECSGLEYVNTGNGITSLNGFYFNHNTNLKNIVIGNSVTNIYGGKFFGCSDLCSITLPVSVETIGDDAFWNCISLDDVYYSGNYNQWKNLHIGRDNERLTSATIHCSDIDLLRVSSISLNKSKLVINVGDSETLTSFLVPENAYDQTVTWTSSDSTIATVSNGTVTGKSQGTAIITAKTTNGLTATCTVTVTPKTIVATRVTLNKSNIYLIVGNSEQLTATVTPSNATDNTVKWTSSNTNVAKVTNGKVTAIKEGLATITAKTGNGLSASCTITVSEINNPIDEDDFHYTIFKNPGEETEVAIYDYTGSAATLIIPDKLEGYPVKSIWDDAFKDCNTLTAVVIPDSVEYIGDNVFENCTNLKSVIIPDNVKGIGWKSFYNCEKLISITIPAGVTSIEGWTFCNCQSLQSIIINGSITSIDSHAFCDCTSLKEFVIPSTVTEIGEQAFWGCSGLKSVTIPVGVTEINNAAFMNCTGLKDVYYDGSESQWNAITIYEENECLLNANIHFKTSENIDPTGVALSKSDISLVIGKNYTLSANILPNNATNKAVTWTSSDSEVARVINGKVTAYKTGITSITATTSNGKTASCRVIVVPDTDTSGLVGDSDADGNVTVMDATCVQYFLSYLPSLDSFKWLASDTDRDGDLSIADATYIQRYVAGMIDNFNHPESISLNAASKKLGVGDIFTLNVSFTPSQVMYREIVWTSNNNGVVTVNNGKVTAKSVGTATITAKTYNGKEAKCSITVAPAPNSVTLNSSDISLDVGGTYQLFATVSPSDANDKTVFWSTSDSTVATVDSTGKITAKSSGSATITATTSNGKKASCTVNVNSIEVSSVSLNAYSITLDEQQTYQLSATVYPSNATNKTLTWSTNNSSVATVTSTGKVTAVSGGTANITAKTTNGKSASCTVTVNEKIMPKSVEVLPKVLTLTVGKTFELNAKITPNNAVDKSVSWSSSNSNAVSVDQNGKLVANKAGMSATITARTVNGLTSTVTVDTVKDSKEYYEILNKASQTADKQYWVVFNEGYRNDRIEMSSFTAKQGFKVSWDKGVYCNNQIGECTQYVYNEETKEFVKIGTYSNLTDYATNIIGSNTSIYDSSGNRIVSPYNSQAQSIGALGVKYDETVYSAPVSQGPYYVSSSGDDLYYILNIDCELYQGATLKMYITSGSSGSYSSYSTVLSSNTYDYKTNKGYISISQYLNNHVGQYIRVYTEVVLANKQVIKPANLGTDDAIYLYMNE